MSSHTEKMPRDFIWRRLHSLFGFWIVLFLTEHLITNSQAALLLGENGKGFIRAVNFIKSLPYLPVVEIVLIGTPIFFHMVWGLKYLFTSKSNAFTTNKAKPSMPYGRSRAFSWQRIASWVLLFGLIGHVFFMRFYQDPAKAEVGKKQAFFVRVSQDSGLKSVSERLGAKLWDKGDIQAYGLKQGEGAYDDAVYKAMTYRKLRPGELMAETKDFGSAELLMVRNSFKNIFTCILYTIFVSAAVFHGFNGLWTFLISWGVVLRVRSQSRALNWCMAAMILVGLLGLVSIWGTYFVNLRR